MGVKKAIGEVPVFYNCLPREMYEALVKAYFAKIVIDLTAGPGKLAPTCLREGIPYVEICMTEDHVMALRERLCLMVLKEMKIETPPSLRALLRCGHAASGFG